MTKEEYIIWLEEHDNKCSISQIRELGLCEKTVEDGTYWMDENGVTVMIAFNIADADINKEFVVKAVDPIIPQAQPPKTDEMMKKFNEWLDTAHYESVINHSDKPFYDKFYERKGRKYRHIK